MEQDWKQGEPVMCQWWGNPWQAQGHTEIANLEYSDYTETISKMYAEPH